MIECESGYFSLIYQGIYYNFRESNNLVDNIRHIGGKGRLSDTELFVFTDNWVFESVFYKGKLKSTMFFETVLQLHELTLEGGIYYACGAHIRHKDDRGGYI